MDFGKVSNLAVLDQMKWELPPLEQRSVDRLKTLKGPNARPVVIKIGCPIWGNKGWLGKVYPNSTPAKDFLYHYARQFNTVELNTSFYRIPDAKTVDSWKNMTGPNFRFCPKFFQGISHEMDLANSMQLTQAFCDSVLKFEDRLGISFLQLPPQMDRSGLGSLAQWLRFIPKQMRVAIEFRHASWFQEDQLHPQVYDLLAMHGAGAVITDVAGRRDVFHGSVPSSFAFVRFVGNQLHPTDYERIDIWVTRICEWVDSGLKALYFFVHQPDDTDSPDLVAYLIDQINARTGWNLPKWENPEVQTGFSFL